MFLGGWLSTILLASSSSNSKYNFQDLSLQIALESYEEAEKFFSEGKYNDACASYLNGIMVGRSSVQKLIETENSERQQAKEATDDPDLALDWLISSYLQCARGRIEMKDWEKARADAWAACSYSQNTNMEALECMLSICENTDDQLGQMQTLKSILAVLSTAGDKENMMSATIESYSVEDLENKIKAIDGELMKKMRGK